MKRRWILRPLTLELIGGFISVGASIYLLRDLLISGFATLPHDNLFWNLPLFSFFAERILNGGLPLWNPFTHGGEPFSPMLLQLRLLDPIPVLTVLVGGRLTTNLVILFNWNRLLQNYTMALGTYLCLRPFFRRTFTRILIIPVLLFSSFFFCSFRQDGISSLYVWIPFVLLFLFRIVLEKRQSTGNWIGLGIFFGLGSQSYYFVGPWTLLLFFLAGTYFFHREEFFALFKNKKGIAISAGLAFLMFLPNFAVWEESSRLVFPLRMVPDHYKETLLQIHGLLPSEANPTFFSPDLKMDYGFVMHTGSFLKIWEWIQLLAPEANQNISGVGRKLGWGDPSESYLFFGLLGWALMMFGIFFGRGRCKKLWLWLTFTFFLMALGPAGLLHPMLFPIFPPLWFLRHTHQFTLFFVLGLFYFLGTGLDRLLSRKCLEALYCKMRSSSVRHTLVSLAYGAGVAALLWWGSRLEYPVFKYSATNFLFFAVAAVGGGGFFLIKFGGRGVPWLGLGVGQVAAVIYLSPHRAEQSQYLFLFLALPTALALLFRRRWLAPSLILATFLLADLGRGLKLAKPLYTGTPPLSYLLGNDEKVQPERFEMTRDAFPLYTHFFYGTQTPRYLETLYRRRFAFSAPLIFANQTQKDHPVTVTHALENPRWNSISLLKNYFDLVNHEMPADALENFFSIGRNVFELRETAVISPPRLASKLAALKTEIRKELLNRVIFLPENSPRPHGRIASWENISGPQQDLSRFRYRLVNYHPENFEVEVSTQMSAYLYWSDGYDPAWQAAIDGKPVPIYRANVNFKAVELPAGIHRLNFRYRPPFLLWSAALFYLAIFGAILWIVAEGLAPLSVRIRRIGVLRE